MKKCTAFLRTSGVRYMLGPSLVLVLGGCEPLSGQALTEFVADFAREALAAWLL